MIEAAEQPEAAQQQTHTLVWANMREAEVNTTSKSYNVTYISRMDARCHVRLKQYSSRLSW